MSIAPAKPSRARATLALALVFAAVLVGADSLRTGWRPSAGWFLGAVAVLLALVLGSWGGTHVTQILRRRIALSSRAKRGVSAEAEGSAKPEAGSSSRVAVFVRVEPPAGAESRNWLPLELIASYLDRYGVRCAAVRVAFRRSRRYGQEAWITLVVDATENLAALEARSARIPLHELAEATRRRLAAQLREEGFAAEHADTAPKLVWAGSEDWNGVVDGEERVAAYAVSTGGDLDARLAEIAAYPAQETWTVLEFTGSPASATLTVACALRKQGVVELLPAGLQPHRGAHLPALAILAPDSTALLSTAASL
ncbi:type VII secretion protein EccE [Segniliparus rugosus]|uniref:Type VII secretion protein EccE n=1 Tax=Segniliparus rugosus (strain ATCC BAA-974 / DSM 45345 / CCUG 50838 / CIP 108380 / JCM 13579 / CDC 945) TaxID=679197 RepID=E5XLU2_SEGRC|nr:type VII secretion protein EccE [Segniliparus rugosus]EFV14669.1 type VII secretion protein EccE [Segniliparus rugosus ATCC BAA-974]